jgi:nucleotide-binding universal stress UspA family protein
MYQKILIPLENKGGDSCILQHIRPLARLTSAQLVLLHVADGWVARNYERLQLAESEEMREDRSYLEQLSTQLEAEGYAVEHILALGDPAAQIIRTAEQLQCDLIAMAAHGHKLIADIFLGSTIEKVRHNTLIPVLVVRVSKE